MHGLADETLVAPESCTLDAALMVRPGNDEIQPDLIPDYAGNVALYPAFQAFFAEHQPPLLVVWGRDDPVFLPAGTEAFRGDNPDAETCLYDTGHFALETHLREIVGTIREFMARIPVMQ